MKIILFLLKTNHFISNDTIVLIQLYKRFVRYILNNLNLSIKFKLKILSHIIVNPQSGEGYQSICKNYPPRSLP